MTQWVYNPFIDNFDATLDASSVSGIDTINNTLPDGSGNFTISSPNATITFTSVTAGLEAEVTTTNSDVVFLEANTYAIQPNDRIIAVLFSGPIDITLPSADTNIGRCITIKACTNSVPINITNGADVIFGDGSGTGIYSINNDGGSVDIWAVSPSSGPLGFGVWVIT